MIFQNEKNKDSEMADRPPTGPQATSNGMSMEVTEDPVIKDTTPQRCHGIFNMTANRVDKISRFIFPFCFAMFNVYYWVNY